MDAEIARKWEHTDEQMRKCLFGFLQKLLELDTVEKKRSLIVNMSSPATQNLPSNTNDVQQQAHSGKFITLETLFDFLHPKNLGNWNDSLTIFWPKTLAFFIDSDECHTSSGIMIQVAVILT